jgi:hypothetical protein
LNLLVYANASDTLQDSGSSIMMGGGGKSFQLSHKVLISTTHSLVVCKRQVAENGKRSKEHGRCVRNSQRTAQNTVLTNRGFSVYIETIC